MCEAAYKVANAAAATATAAEREMMRGFDEARYIQLEWEKEHDLDEHAKEMAWQRRQRQTRLGLLAQEATCQAQAVAAAAADAMVPARKLHLDATFALLDAMDREQTQLALDRKLHCDALLARTCDSQLSASDAYELPSDAESDGSDHEYQYWLRGPSDVEPDIMKFKWWNRWKFK